MSKSIVRFHSNLNSSPRAPTYYKSLPKPDEGREKKKWLRPSKYELQQPKGYGTQSNFRCISQHSNNHQTNSIPFLTSGKFRFIKPRNMRNGHRLSLFDESGTWKSASKSLHRKDVRLRQENIQTTQSFFDNEKSRTLVKILKKISVFNELKEQELLQLIAVMQEYHYNPNDCVITQGDIGLGFFIIKNGVAIVSRQDPETKVVKFQKELFKGDFFGEVALLENVKRGASVCAKTKLTVYFLNKTHFENLFRTSTPRLLLKRGNISNGELYGQKFMQPKPKATAAMLRNALKDTVLFRDVTNFLVDKIVEIMRIKKVTCGEYIIKEGEGGDEMYILDSGRLQVSVNGHHTIEVPYGKCFGEVALLCKYSCRETVQATQDSVLWCIDRITYKRTVRDVTQHRLHKRKQYLSKIQVFSAWKKKKT